MEEVKRNSLRAWILAARPKTLTGAITPVMIGSALAYMDGHFQWLPALICCLFAGLMQIAANFINDLFDYLKGTDREDRLGPERACAQGWISPRAMRNGIIVTVLKKKVKGEDGEISVDWINNDLITFVKDRLGHDQRYAIDPTKITNALGWYPETKFEDGIVKTIVWYLENQDWVEEVTSGDYQGYYEKMYGK